jgi:hypothetical protein
LGYTPSEFSRHPAGLAGIPEGIIPEELLLNLQWNEGRPLFLWDIEPDKLTEREIITGHHCFGCTAGCGSSCSGALVS